MLADVRLLVRDKRFYFSRQAVQLELLVHVDPPAPQVPRGWLGAAQVDALHTVGLHHSGRAPSLKRSYWQTCPNLPWNQIISFFFSLMFIFERQTECGRKRGRQSIQSRLWAVSTEPDMGLEPTDHEIMTWAKVRHLTNWATKAPHNVSFLLKKGFGI